MRAFQRGTAVVLLSVWAAGCMVPLYRLPAGFSGTYHRSLYGPGRGVWFPPPGVQPVPVQPGFGGPAAEEVKPEFEPAPPPVVAPDGAS
jgi:hypothetical protein